MAPHAVVAEDLQGLQQLRDWLKMQPHLPDMPDRLLARMLHSCYGSVERTKSTVDNYVTITTHAPEVFGNRAALDRRYKSQIDIMYVCVLKERTKEGYTPILIKFQDTDPAKFDMSSAVHAGLMSFCVQMEVDDRVPGYVVMLDFTGITMSHIMKVSLTVLKQLLVFVQEGLPVRLRGIHFINSQPLVQQIVNLVKPLMKKELLEIFHVHTIEEMPQFYEKFVSQTSMPSDHGGNDKTCKELHGEMKQCIESSKEYLKMLDGLLADETKRPGKSKSSSEVFGIQGSFKKLDLD